MKTALTQSKACLVSSNLKIDIRVITKKRSLILKCKNLPKYLNKITRAPL